jgi:hypothetical protein
MRKIRVSDLDNWPPEPGGSFGKGYVLRVTPSEAKLSGLHRRAGRRVTFECTCERNTYTYDYDAKTERIAVQLAVIVLKYIGKPLSSFGEIEIEE